MNQKDYGLFHYRVSSNFFTSFYVFGLKLILGRNSIYLEGTGVYKYIQLGKAKNKKRAYLWTRFSYERNFLYLNLHTIGIGRLMYLHYHKYRL